MLILKFQFVCLFLKKRKNLLLFFAQIPIFLIQVKSKAELTKVLDEYSVGDKVKLAIKRGSEDLELQISLEEKSS